MLTAGQELKRNFPLTPSNTRRPRCFIHRLGLRHNGARSTRYAEESNQKQCAPGQSATIGVPFGRPINPVTKGDWEGKGVEPDVKVSAADALTTAEKLAADKLATKDNQR